MKIYVRSGFHGMIIVMMQVQEYHNHFGKWNDIKLKTSIRRFKK